MIIGITGSIGSGKSTVSKNIKEKGYCVIDVDKISHNLLEEKVIIEQLVSTFSNAIIENGKVNRKKLGKIVFNNKDELIKLNEIIHPKLIDEIKKIISFNGNDFLFFDIPLLFELNLEYLFDKIICVYISKNKQIKRIKKRDQRKYREIRNIIRSQMNVDEKKERSDYLLNNNSKKIKKKVRKILKGIYENSKI